MSVMTRRDPRRIPAKIAIGFLYIIWALYTFALGLFIKHKVLKIKDRPNIKSQRDLYDD